MVAPAGKTSLENHGATTGKYLYRSVTDALRKRIIEGSYPAGKRLPAVSELSREFGVSTITVRRAVRELTLEGLLVGRQGLGIFVAQKKRIIRSLSVDRIIPIEKDMEAAGTHAHLEAMGTTVVPYHDEPFLVDLAQRQKKLLRLERKLFADNEPVGLDFIWMTRQLGQKFGSEMHGDFLVSKLSRIGIDVRQIDYHVEATTATEAQATALGIVTGFPLLVIRFFPVDDTGKTILVGETTTRADCFTYKFGGRV